MKANELMIGDYIYQHHPKDNTPHIVKVSIDTLNLMYKMEIDFIREQSPLYRIIEPIPLTPEILEKNGFEYNDGNAKYYPNCWEKNGILLRKRTLNGFFYLVTSDYDDQDTNSTSIIITYVHELQHLLKLCRIEKTIEP